MCWYQYASQPFFSHLLGIELSVGGKLATPYGVIFVMFWNQERQKSIGRESLSAFMCTYFWIWFWAYSKYTGSGSFCWLLKMSCLDESQVLKQVIQNGIPLPNRKKQKHLKQWAHCFNTETGKSRAFPSTSFFSLNRKGKREYFWGGHHPCNPMMHLLAQMKKRVKYFNGINHNKHQLSREQLDCTTSYLFYGVSTTGNCSPVSGYYLVPEFTYACSPVGCTYILQLGWKQL